MSVSVRFGICFGSVGFALKPYMKPTLMDEFFSQIDPDKILARAPCVVGFLKEAVPQYAMQVMAPMIVIGLG